MSGLSTFPTEEEKSITFKSENFWHKRIYNISEK